MTSTNDGKDVKSNQTSAPKGKSHFIELYKSLESRLSEVCESSERTQHLCTAWSQVHTLCLHSAQSTQSHLLSWLQRHTARTILQTEWQTPKRKEDRARLESAINAFISQCPEVSEERDRLPWETQLVARGEWFKKVLDRPWDHPVLGVLLNPNGTPPTDDEVLKWLKEERGVTFVMRLHTLVGEKCEDIAVSLAAAVMERVRASTLVTPDQIQVEETKDKPKLSPVSSFGEKLTAEAGFTPDVWELLTDIEFVLLHKRDSSRCIGLAKQTPLRSAYQLVERLQSRLELSPKEKRLWKNAKDVAVLIAQVVIARCMVVPVCAGVARGALYCCAKSLARALGPRLAPATAALAAPAASAKHLHTLAQAVDAHFAQSNDTKMKPFVCELYVRAITAGMNELERLKIKTEKEPEARQMEKTLSQWFMQLGSVLSASDRIMCECTLTAFSVHPSVQMYDKIKEAPLLPNIVEQIEPKLESISEFGSWASDSRSQTNFVKTSETLNMKSQQQANVLSNAIFNEGEALGLSPDLCQDIAVLLSGPRVKTLTWDMDREQLVEHCRIYMERTHQGTRALTTELKFLNLNPQEFMHLPEEEDDEDDVYYGIEKGYEHLVPLQDPDDIWNDTERTESALSAIEEKEIVIPRRKKKPKALVITSDDERDPLSLVAENKRIDKKKEHLHSKERKKKEPGEVRAKEPKEKKEKKKKDRDKPEKEKKERKKKEKIPKTEVLASLVGLKAAKIANQDMNETVLGLVNFRSCISDSDYDSQGKSSMTSINSVESDVLFDGNFSMDPCVDNMGLMKSNELRMSNGKVGVHHPLANQQKLMARELLNQAPLNSVREDVKRSIYKLIDYRRQRAAMQQTDNPLSTHAFQSNFESAKDYLNRQNPVKILNNTLPSSENKLYNASSRPSTSLQSCISPKAVVIPDIPKSIINKHHSEKLAQLKREIDSILATKNKPYVSSSIQSPVIQFAKKSTEDSAKSFKSNQAKAILYPPGPTLHQNPIRMKDLVTVGQERYGPYEVTKPVFAQSRPSLPVHRPPITETPGESSYKKFLAEFQRTVDMPVDTPQTKKQIKPVSRVTPVIPHVKADPPQRAKLMPQQKKPDNSLNTFSRRSYMYKNKQADVKKAFEASQDINTPRPSLESKIEDFVWDHLRRSTQDQTPSYNSLPKVSNEYAQNVKRSEMKGGSVNSHNNTIMSHILGHADSKNDSNSTCGRSTPKPVAKPVTPPKSNLSEQDQADLLNLLRQRNTFNPTPQPVKQQMHNTVAPPPLPGPPGHSKDNTVPAKTANNKVINIISSTIIKPPSKTTTANTKPTIISKKSVKNAIEQSKKIEYKTDVKKSDEISSEFQSVFNALRAQKTPSRGPNALDVALNKSSFAKAFEDSLRQNHNVVIPNEYKDPQISKSYNTPQVQDNVTKSAADPKNVKSKTKGKTNVLRKDTKFSDDQPKQSEIPKSNDMKTIRKKPINVEPKKCLNENLKKKITYVKTTEVDPFISGIRNSDYDLLEELMDDDLRKEIGELSSDEESFCAPATNLIKPAKTSEKYATVPFNKPIEICSQSAKPVIQPQTVKQDVCVQRPPVTCVFENKAVQGPSKHQTTPICSKITDTCSKTIAASKAQQNPQIHDYNNTSTFASNQMTNNSNLYVSAGSQPPAQNVVLIGSNIVYEGYPAVPTPIHTVTNTAYVVNSVPNMTLYQPTQYVQPVINPVIIESTVPVPLISTVQYSSISVEPNVVSNLINPELIQQNINNETQVARPTNMPQQTNISYEEIHKKESRLSYIQQNSLFHPDTATKFCLQEPSVISNNIMPKTYSAPMQPKTNKLSEHIITESSELSYKLCTENIALDSEFKQDNIPKLEFKTANLSEHTTLNENHIRQDIKIPEIINKTIERKVLSEVQEKQILSAEKQLTPEMTENKAKYQTIDSEKPIKSSQDQERLKNKRMAIINRKISHYSEETPIPLSYSPLSPANDSVIETKSDPVEETDSFTKSSPQETVGGESRSQNVKDNCKENKSDAALYRRILLRSSNKLQNKVTGDLQPTPKKSSKKTAQTDKTIIQKDEEKPVTLKRESKRIRNKVVNKNKSPDKQQKVLKVKLNVGRKASLKTKYKKVPRMTSLVTEAQPIDIVGPFDFEAQLMGAKILKTQLSEQKTENSKAVWIENSKDEVTEIDTKEPQMLIEQSNNDKEELSSHTTEIPKKNESESTTESAKTDNEITEHPTKETVQKDTKKSELMTVEVPKTINDLQDYDITGLDKNYTYDKIHEESITTNSVPDALDKNSHFLKKQESSLFNTTNLNKDALNIRNENDLLKSETINSQSESKDSTISSGDNDKTEKIQYKTDFAHRTGVNLPKEPDTEKSSTDAQNTKKKIDSFKKLEMKKSSTDVSAVTDDNTLSMPSALNSDNDFAVIDKPEKLEETKLEDNKANSDNITISDIPQSFKDSISIEPLPSRSSDNPLKRCVRIKLPNGRVFKATVTGEVSVNFDTLFEQPSLRSVLINNINCKQKYTLNIKQVTTISKHNNKVLSTQIQEVNELPQVTVSKHDLKVLPTQIQEENELPRKNLAQVIDTVSLLSDDEDESQQEFETEFGKYKIQTMDTDSYNKHQEKLKLRPIIVLEKKEISQSNQIQNNTSVENEIDLTCNEKLEKLEFGKNTEKIGVESLNNQAEGIESDIDDVVFIDDSSDDDISNKNIPEKGIDKLKDNLLKDLGVGITESNAKDDTEVLKEKLLMDLGLNIEPDSKEKDNTVRAEGSKVKDSVPLVSIEIPEIDLTEDNVPVETNTSTNVTKTNNCKKMDLTSQCYVKLVRCDNLVETITISSKEKPMEQVAESGLDCLKPRSRSISFSILDDFPLLSDVTCNDVTCSDLDRSSPVIEVFDFIASHESFVGHKSQTLQAGFISSDGNEHDDAFLSVTCSADWFETKKTNHVSSKKLSTTVTSSLPLIDTSNTPFVELPSLTTLTLKYLQDRDLITALKPIRDLKVLRTLKRKSESSQTLGSPKTSKPTLIAATKSYILNVSDPHLTDAPLTTVLNDESYASKTSDEVKTSISDLLNHCITRVVSSPLESKNLSYNNVSKIQEANYTAVSAQATLHNVQQEQIIPNNPDHGSKVPNNMTVYAILESTSRILQHAEYENNMVETDARVESIPNHSRIKVAIAVIENDTMQESKSKNPRKLSEDDDNIAEMDAIQESILNYSENKIEDLNGTNEHDEMPQSLSNNNEQVADDYNSIAETGTIHNSTSNISEHEIKDANDKAEEAILESMSSNPEQIVKDDDHMAETDVIQESILKVSEETIEDSNDMTKYDTVQQSTSKNPEQLVEDDNNIIYETNAIQESTLMTPELRNANANDIIENDAVQQSTSNKPEQPCEDDYYMTETDTLQESTSNTPELRNANDIIENVKMPQSTSNNPHQLCENDYYMTETDSIQESNSNTTEQKNADANGVIENNAVQQSTSNNPEQLCEDDYYMAETDAIQESISNIAEQQINNANDMAEKAILESMSYNPGQIVKDVNNTTETEVIQKSISKVSEKTIEDSNDMTEYDTVQQSTSKKPEQLFGHDNNINETNAIQESTSNTPELRNADANDIIENDAVQQSTSNNPEQPCEGDYYITKTDALQESTSNTSEQKNAGANDVIENDAVQQSTSNNPEQPCEGDYYITKTDALQESTSNTSEQKNADANDVIENDAMQQPTSNNPEQFCEDDYNMAETGSIQEPTSNTSELKNADANDIIENDAVQQSTLNNPEKLCEDDYYMAETDETDAIQESMSSNPEQIVKGDDYMTETDVIQESISKVSEETIEDSNDINETNAIQESTSNNPELLNANDIIENNTVQQSKVSEETIEDSNDINETNAIQESTSNTPELLNANDIIENDTLQQSTSNNSDQLCEDDYYMTETDVIQESISKVSEETIEDSNHINETNAIQESTSNNPELLNANDIIENDTVQQSKVSEETIEDSNDINETNAIQESTSNTPELLNANDIIKNDTLQQSTSNNSDQLCEDDYYMTETDAIQESTSNTPEQKNADTNNMIKSNAVKEVKDDDHMSETDVIQESILKVSEETIEDSNDKTKYDTMQQSTSNNTEQLVEDNYNMTKTGAIQESNICELKIVGAYNFHNNSTQESRNSELVVEAADITAETDKRQESISNTLEQIGNANYAVNSMQKSRKSEKVVENHDYLTETETNQKSIAIITEQKIEHAIDIIQNNTMQDSISGDPKEEVKYNHDTAENAIKQSKSMNPEAIQKHNYKDNNEMAKNLVIQKSILADEEPQINIDNDIAFSDANLQPVSNNSQLESNSGNDIDENDPVHETETDGNNVVDNNGMQVSMTDNQELDTNIDNKTTDVKAIHESISSKPERDFEYSNNITSLKESVSDNPEHDIEDRVNITKDAIESIGNQFNQKSIFEDDNSIMTNYNAIQKSKSNNHVDEAELQNSMCNNTIQESILDNLQHITKADQELLSNNSNILQMNINCERDPHSEGEQQDLPSDTDINANDSYDKIKTHANEKLKPINNEAIEVNVPNVGQLENSSTDTDLYENIESGLSILSRAAELHSYRIIKEILKVKDDTTTNSNIEDTTTVLGSPDLNEDVKFESGPKSTAAFPDNLNDVNIVSSTNVSYLANNDLKIEKVKNEDIKHEKITVPQATTETTEKESVKFNLEGNSNYENTVKTSVLIPTKGLDGRLEIMNDQENSNQSSDGALKWDMSIANADHTINEPLERNAKQIITKILKLTGNEGSEVILKGIQYEDPQVGTCYMFPLIEPNNQSDQSEVNLEIPNQDEIMDLIRKTTDEVTNEIDNNFEIAVPTHTYSRQNENVGVQRNLKRKKSMSDLKMQGKRYRKGKNIDYPKFTSASMSETVYAKEYTRLMDYCSTVKFSYSRPFHKEQVEVSEMHTNWPIVKTEENMHTDPDVIQENLFTEIEEDDTILVDPREQTLAQELTIEYNENDYKPINIVETNFNMGFGERSDRVIHYTKKTKINTSKLSAATLSDVKPFYQPYLTSEINNTEIMNIDLEQNEEKVKLRHVKFMEMRDKVRTFFQKTTAELVNDTLTKKSEDNNNFPFGLTSTEFLTSMSQEVLTNVVQVGQLPVSAAAQNPVTCDPRVTHVTNVSPSQCSAESSPGDDNQTSIKTEYTELTTADMTLPLVQEYAHHLQQLSSSNCQEPLQTHDSNCGSTEIKAQIKIELKEESSQERLEDQTYEQLASVTDNNNINNGAYHFHEIPSSTTADNASHVQQSFQNAILEAMNGQSNNNNTTVNGVNGHNFNNSIIENEIKEEINESCPNNIISDNVMNGQHNTAIEDTVTNQMNNNLPVSDAMNRQGTNNTTVEQPRNDQRLNNTTAEVTMNTDTTMDSGMNGHNINNNTPDQVAMKESLNNISTTDNVLNGQKTNNTNAENQTNVQILKTPEEEAINKQNGNNTVASEKTNAQSIVQEPKNTNLYSEIHCNQQSDKTDQLAHAMNAAGITLSSDVINTSDADALVDIISQNAQSDVVTTSKMNTNSFTKSTPINAMALQQALAQILPPPLNQTTVSDNSQPNTNAPPVLHIVQGSNSQTVINKQNGTPLLHIVQNKAATNGTPSSQANSFSGLSLVDTGLQQGGNQLLHIVNTGNQKNNNAGQLLKRVNLLTNIANVQGGNEQKMVQFVCKSADGKSIQLNAPHQRSMVLRLQPIDPSTIQTAAKPTEPVNQDVSPNTGNTLNNKDVSQQDIKSRSVYEENYAKFIQNGTDKPGQERATSLPKFNQVFGKQVYQENKNEMNNDGISEHTDGQQTDNNINLEGINDINSPPLLLRKSPPQTSQAQANLVQQIKQTIAPMNIQTMHGGVIYTRQIPVNIGGGQTINLITVPSTELVEDSNQKQQADGKFIHQEGDHVIKIVPHSQANNASNEENNAHVSGSNETPQNPQPQPVLTQMRIKLPMLSKTPHMVSGARVVRPSFFQIQRNFIGGANQPVYQQLVLTTAPSLGQTIRVPAQTRPAKPPESQSSPESQMSSSTLEQLREFDMVLEQVKERSTVNPGSSHSSYSSRHSSADTTDSSAVRSKSVTETTQVMYTTENNQTIASYVNRKSTVTSASTSSFVRSPDSSGIVESPSSSTHSHIPHTSTSTSESTSSETPSQPKPKKKKKSSVSSSNPAMKMPPATPKPSSQKPLEDEQTTQRILYILAEYKEQVENSPDKDKPAPRRRNNLPPNLGSSKRKKSSSGSRRRDMSPIHGEDSCRTMGSEDSSCGTSLSECAECMESHSPQESPRKVVRKLTFEQETTQITTQTRTTTIPQRNVIVADGQTITVARGATGKPATTVLMPANYLLPVSMVKGGQQIAIVTNRGPKLLVGGGEGGTGGTLLFQRLIGPAGLKPVLTRPGVRHIRLPTAALHNLQAFNIATHATTTQPADSTASPASAPTPPDLVDTRAMSSPWPDREAQEATKPDRGSSPEDSEPWNLPSSSIADDYGYEEIVRTDNMDRTVLDAIPDRYSPDMEAQRIFDKMFDVDSKKSMYDSRCGYDIDASDTDDRPYQVVQRRDGRHHRLTHVSAAALRHKYAILEHELRLQKSLSEECEDLGVDSPSAAELFPEAELFFAPSPVHEQTIGPCLTPQPTILNQGISQPDLEDQIATDHLLTHQEQQLDINLDDVGEIVTVGEDGIATIPLDHEEFARSHPNTTFHTEPEEGEIPPFTISQSIKGRQITFHAGRSSGTVVMAPQTTVISQATVEASGTQNTVKFTDIDNMINAMPTPQQQTNTPSSVLVKDSGLTRFDNILTDSRELHLTNNTASAIVHSTGQGTQVIRRVRYDDRRDQRYMIDDPDAMMEEKIDDNRDMESMAGDEASSPERHPELFWESNSASERSEGRRRLDFSSDSDKCCKSPFDEASTDSSFGNHTRLDSVIKAARTERSGSGSSDDHPPLRTYPPKRVHVHHHDAERSVSGKTRAGETCLDMETRRRASNRGVVKRGCHCCSGSPSPAPPKPKKSRQKKPSTDFTNP